MWTIWTSYLYFRTPKQHNNNMLGFKGALSLTLSFWLFCTVVSWYSFNGGSCCNGMLQLLSGGQKFQYHEGLCRSGSTGKRPKEDGANFLYLRVPLDVLCVFPRCFPCCSVGVSADIPHKGGLPLHITGLVSACWGNVKWIPPCWCYRAHMLPILMEPSPWFWPIRGWAPLSSHPDWSVKSVTWQWHGCSLVL